VVFYSFDYDHIHVNWLEKNISYEAILNAQKVIPHEIVHSKYLHHKLDCENKSID
jgi:hypothetical protein